MAKNKTEELIKIFVASIETAEKNRNSYLRFSISFLFDFKII